MCTFVFAKLILNKEASAATSTTFLQNMYLTKRLLKSQNQLGITKMIKKAESILDLEITKAIKSKSGYRWKTPENRRKNKETMRLDNIAKNLYEEYKQISPTKKLSFSVNDTIVEKSKTKNIAIFVEAPSVLFSNTEWQNLLEEVQQKLQRIFSVADMACRQASNVFPEVCVKDPAQMKFAAIETAKDIIYVDSKPQKQLVEEIIYLAQGEQEIQYKIGGTSHSLATFPAIAVNRSESDDIILDVLIPALDNYKRVADISFPSKHHDFGWKVKQVSFTHDQKQKIKDVHYFECLAKIKFSTIVETSANGEKEKVILYAVKEVVDIMIEQTSPSESEDLFVEV